LNVRDNEEENVMRIAVIGATGNIGARTVTALRAAGHEVVEIARSKGVDARSPEQLDTALAGVEAVVDASSVNSTDEAEAVEFFTSITSALVAAEQRAGVRHHVLLSIVNVDVPRNPHYTGKVAQEKLVTDSSVPWSIVRATQFHDFAEMAVGWTLDNGTATVPPLLVRPIAPDDVASVLAEVAAGEPVGRIDVAGPDTQDLVDMARRTYTARGEQITLIPSWDVVDISMSGNALLPGPGARITPTTFDEWLTSLR